MFKLIGKILIVILYAVMFLGFLVFLVFQMFTNTELHLRIIAFVIWSACIGGASFTGGIMMIFFIKQKRRNK